MFAVNSLISFLISELFLNIRRKWHLTDFIQNSIDIGITIKFNNSVAIIKNVNNLALKLSLAKNKFRSYFCFFARLAKTFPNKCFLLFQKQKFNYSSGFFFNTEYSCRNDSCIIKNQAIAGI